MTEQKKLFGTDGIRGKYGDKVINANFMEQVAVAVSKVLGCSSGSSVVVGHDSRVSGPILEAGLRLGFLQQGINVHYVDVLPTPAIAFAASHYSASAGVMISASHNPYHDNGVKFFNGNGFKLSTIQEKKIEAFLANYQVSTAPELGYLDYNFEAAEIYRAHCYNRFANPISLPGMRIVIDTANGAASAIAERFFYKTDASLHLINCMPDGSNINNNCGSTKPEQLQQTVRQEKAAIGIAFDGDGDRVILVDEQGNTVDGDQILFIIANYLQQTKRLKGGVVGTLMSNFGLESALQKLAIPFIRSDVGDRYVMEQLQREAWQLGGEASGHIINLAMSTTGDGLLTALHILHIMEKTDKPLSELAGAMEKCPQVLINVPVENRDNILSQPEITEAAKQIEADLAGKGRVLLRPSGTEPVLRVMVEGEDQAVVQTAAEKLAGIVAEASTADCSVK